MTDTSQAIQVTTPGSGGLLGKFVLPLLRGQKVIIDEPLSRGSLGVLLGELFSDSRTLSNLQAEMLAYACRIVPAAPAIEVGPDDVKLVAAAYQVCWFFHEAVEKGQVWERRLENYVEETHKLLGTVGLPRSEGQMLGRHLLLRHFPRIFRTDTRLEFRSFWDAIEFLGTEPKWSRWPLRGNPIKEERQVWIHRHVYTRPAGKLYYGVMSRSPLTGLLQCDRLHPQFTFWGTVTALALPSLCRAVTNHYIEMGLEPVMPALASSFRRFVRDEREPISHRRYIARFLLNLGITWAYFASPEQLDQGPTNPAEKDKKSKKKTAGIPDHRKDLLDPRNFYLVFEALYQLRGPLGGVHLLSEPGMEARVERFIQSASLQEGEKEEMRSTVALSLGYLLP